MMTVAVFAAIHLFVGRLRRLDAVPRSGWLSFAGGSAVAYVFLHILPELAEHQTSFARGSGFAVAQIDLFVYALALVGVVVFYMAERQLVLSRAEAGDGGRAGMDESDPVYRMHVTTFALYNLLIAYLLLHREERGLLAEALFAFAMALHLLTTDFAMWRDHADTYDRRSRWILTGGSLAGFVLGLVVELPELFVGCLFAFLAGGTVLNVLKEELPEERESRALPFLAGALFYAGLLIAERMLA